MPWEASLPLTPLAAPPAPAPAVHAPLSLTYSLIPESQTIGHIGFKRSLWWIIYFRRNFDIHGTARFPELLFGLTFVYSFRWWLLLRFWEVFFCEPFACFFFRVRLYLFSPLSPGFIRPWFTPTVSNGPPFHWIQRTKSLIFFKPESYNQNFLTFIFYSGKKTRLSQLMQWTVVICGIYESNIAVGVAEVTTTVIAPSPAPISGHSLQSVASLLSLKTTVEL